MIIPISDDWRVKVEGMNFILEHLQPTKPHKSNNYTAGVRWVLQGYYPSLKRALQALPDHLALSPGVTTLEGYMEAWDVLVNRLTAKLGK